MTWPDMARRVLGLAGACEKARGVSGCELCGLGGVRRVYGIVWLSFFNDWIDV